MNKNKAKKKQKKVLTSGKMIIDSKELMLKVPGKLGTHVDQVKSGCGVHQSKKQYTRKMKHKQLVSS